MKELKDPIVYRLVEEKEIISDYVFEKIADKVIFFGYFENIKYKQENGLNVGKESKEVLLEEVKESLINNGYKELEDTKDLVYSKPLQTNTSNDEDKGNKDDLSDKKHNIKEEDNIETEEDKKQTTVREEFKRVKKQEFLKFFREGLGIITLTCKRINISRNAFYTWYRADAKFKETVDGIKAEQCNEVEDKLLKAITDGNIAAIIFYLKSKHPEYRQRLALEGELGLKGDYKRLSDEDLAERIRKYTSKSGGENN